MSARSLDRRVLILLAICAVLVVTYSIIRGATGTSDFKNPYRVARIFWETGVLDIRGEPRYPPTVRVLMAPLAALPLGVAAAIWALASLAAILSVKLMLDHLGQSKAATAIQSAVASVLKASKVRTPDLGGNATTTQMADAVLGAVG